MILKIEMKRDTYLAVMVVGKENDVDVVRTVFWSFACGNVLVSLITSGKSKALTLVLLSVNRSNSYVFTNSWSSGGSKGVIYNLWVLWKKGDVKDARYNSR